MQTQSFHNLLTDLGNNLFQIRKSRGLTQESVANSLGMDRVSIGYIEQGKRAPRLSTLFSLAELYDVSLKEIFDFDKPEEGEEGATFTSAQIEQMTQALAGVMAELSA